MKVEAYRCDHCGKIQEEKYIHGINPIEDLFDKLHSYQVTTRPEVTNVHFCNDCYRTFVTVPATNLVNRKKDEQGYKMKLIELSAIFKRTCVLNVRTNKVFTK